MLRIFTNISAEISIEMSKIKAINNHITFYQVASRYMENSFYASKFKCLRGLDTKQVTELLRNWAEGELSFAELKQRVVEVKNMAALRTEFVKKAGCRSWKEAAERYSFNYYHL